MYGIHTAFSGRLGADPEPKYTANGKLLLTFRVAVDEPAGDGQERGETTWIKVTVWEEKAEALQATLLKGMACYCRGPPQAGDLDGQGWRRPGAAWPVRRGGSSRWARLAATPRSTTRCPPPRGPRPATGERARNRGGNGTREWATTAKVGC